MLRQKTQKTQKKTAHKKVGAKKSAHKVQKRNMNTEATERGPVRPKVPVTGVKLFNKQAVAEFRSFAADVTGLPAEGLFVMRDGEEQALLSLPVDANAQQAVDALSGQTFKNLPIQAHDGLFAASLGRDQAKVFTAAFRISQWKADGERFEGEVNVPPMVVASKLRRFVPVLSVHQTPRNPATYRVRFFDRESYEAVREQFSEPEQRVISVAAGGEYVPLKFALQEWKTFTPQQQEQQQDNAV